ncbi:MAG: DUF5320 domain-containing protein [Candidatus Kaelpia imicola]|nr:DUF5320 domain-containing protein [Candidatus Kaelpia imicola]
MPGGDGAGPAGMGPMTGRGAGYCAGYSTPGYMNPVSGGGFGYGFGRGLGRGRGFGRGMGRGFGFRASAYPYYPVAYPYTSDLSPQQEAGMLKEQLKAMQDEVNIVNERIKELESSAGSKEK